MAFYDDKRWLLKHIRHSFITGDDTQLCEHVLLNHDFPLPQHTFDSDDDQVINDEDVSNRLAESPDVFVGSALHRPRTYTAIRLEKIKKDREECGCVKQVVWSATKESDVSEAELNDMFSKKVVVGAERDAGNTRKTKLSKLTEMLMSEPAIPPNPYAAFSRFDGSHCFGDVAPKRMKIFLTMLPAPARDIPLEISVIPSAKIAELIGLILWQYTNQRRLPHLPHESPDGYKLLFAEEDGEYDYDFPALEKCEVISKFHFTSLALVEAASLPSSGTSISHSRSHIALAKVIILPSRDVVDVVLPNAGVGLTISDLLTLTEQQCPSDQIVNRLKSKTFIVKDKGDSSNTILSLNTRIADCRSREFILAPSETRAEEIRMRKHLSVIEAALYQSFNVSQIQRMRKTDIHLGISREKIEVNPVANKNPRLGGILRGAGVAKAITYDFDSIVDCSIVDEKYGKKAVVRLVHKTDTGEYKNLNFECNHDTARTIDQKCKHILNLLGSVARQEYLESDAGRKTGKKWFLDN